MGKDGKSRFFTHSIRHFIQLKKNYSSRIKKFVIEWYQIFILNYKTDFSKSITKILKSKVFRSFSRKIMKNFFFFF